MAKKKVISAIRQLYQKAKRRIDRAILKLRSQGYDITNIQLPPEPKRVTKKALAELEYITPKKLRAQATYKGYVPPKGTPLRTDGHFTTQQEAYERWKRLSDKRIARETKQAEIDSIRKKERLVTQNIDTLSEKYTDESPTGTFDDFMYEFEYGDDTSTFTESSESVENEPVETYPEIVDNEIIYRDVKTGEEVDRSPLAIEEGDETITYYDAFTGEIIKTEPNLYDFQGYDATELALDNLRSILSAYPAQIANHFNALLDRMIDSYGMNTVGNAIQSLETKNGQSILESLQSAPNAYDEIVDTFSEIIEELPFTDEEKENLRVEFSLHEPFSEVT